MITSAQVASFLGLENINADNFEIKKVRAPDNLCEKCITLLTRIDEFENSFKNASNEVVAIIPNELKNKARKFKQFYIFSQDPRLSFAKVLDRFFAKPFAPEIADTAQINTDKKIHQKVRIGEYSVISGSVEIGEGTEIMDHVVIKGCVRIGKHTLIKSGSIIGQKGFNFLYDEKKVPIEFQHFGKVFIGDYVEIGALNTVVQGTLGNTVISDYVKTDDHVHIAHNVKIGRATLITACAEISGSVEIGSYTWLGPNCSIIDHISIGNNVLVGLGAVVKESIPDNHVISGGRGKIYSK